MPPTSKLARFSFLESALRAALGGAYRQVQVDPGKYLVHLQRAHRLPVENYDDLLSLGPAVLRPHAERIIRASSRLGALDGAGFGLAGVIFVVPDVGVLATITVRMLQKLSLLYGFNYTTEEEEVEFLLAAASAAGLDLGCEFLEKQAMEQVAPRLVERIAAKVGAEVAEDWVGKMIPLLSAGIAGTLNYYFVRTWGRRAQKHFESRHHSVRGRILEATPVSVD